MKAHIHSGLGIFEHVTLMDKCPVGMRTLAGLARSLLQVVRTWKQSPVLPDECRRIFSVISHGVLNGVMASFMSV